MRLSPRMLSVAGIAFVLLAVLFAFLRAKHGLFSETGENTHAKADWNSNATRKHDSREDTKRARKTRSLGMEDPEVQRQAEEWYQELLARHPKFQVEFRDVPDEENGFLQYLDLLDELNPGDPHNAKLTAIDEDFGNMLAGRTTFDRALLDTWIEKNPDLFQRILSIAEAPGQSVKGMPMDRYHFVSASPARNMSQLLDVSARAAMERGDPDAALRYHRASVNLANHFDGTEIPSLLGKTISTLLRLTSIDNFHQHILPELVDNPEALAKWRETLPQPEHINDVTPSLFKGEWHLATRMYLLPSLISGAPEHLGDIPTLSTAEQYALAESYTSQMSDYIDVCSSQPFTHLIDPSRDAFTEDPTLSPTANNILETVFIGADAWLKGSSRQISITAQHDALLAIALGEEPPLEPLSGEPFLWAPENRTLSPPAALDEFRFDIKPLKLPSAR